MSIGMPYGGNTQEKVCGVPCPHTQVCAPQHANVINYLEAR